mgnify:CR=1 FL=1
MGNHCNFAKTNIINNTNMDSNTEQLVKLLLQRIEALEKKLNDKENIIVELELAAKLNTSLNDNLK